MPFISYADNFEDVMLWRALRDVQNGFYIDVGAADPVDISVTRAFYDAGWRGVNIEPSRHYFERLQALRPADVNLNIAVAEAPGTGIFYEIPQTGLSTLDETIAAGHREAGWTVEVREVPIKTLAEICRLHAPGEIHFLKIDVEGAEAEVLAGADFSAFRPWIVVLEATRPLTTVTSTGWEPVILDAGYKFVWFDGLNRFYIAEEHHAELQQHFRLPPNPFDYFVKYDFKMETRLAEQQQALADAEIRLRERANEIKLLEGEMLLLRKMQHDTAARQIHLTREVAALGRDLDQARDYAAKLDRLVFDLRWDDGPRALKLVLPLARGLRKLTGTKPPPEMIANRIRPAQPRDQEAPDSASESGQIIHAPRPAAQPVISSGVPLRRAVHQFHPGCAYGDAVTNSMLLTQRILRGLGYQSEIYVQHMDDLLAGQIRLLDDLPVHDDYVLIMLHSLGYDQAERIAALPAPKIMMYHNITPAHLLAGIPGLARYADLGREQLDFWRTRTVAALAVSEFNMLELRQHGYEWASTCPLLFDIDALRARATSGEGREPGQPFTVLFVGRIVESKGQAELADAFAEFHARYQKPCRLVLVGRTEGGGGGYVADLYRRIGELGLRQAVTITGQVSDDELIAWYNRADIYVSLSLHEGFGVPLIEAMVHDLPVIAFAAGAVPFTMDRSGVIIGSREPGDVAEAMLAVAADPARRAAIIEAQRQNLDRFRLSRHVPALLQALARAGALPPVAEETRLSLEHHLNFAVAGHVNGTYSLASVNRSLALALDDVSVGSVRVLPVEEGTPSTNLDGVPASEAEAVRRLALSPAPATAPLVIISQHYPVYVPEQPADLAVAYFFWEESSIPWETVDLLNRSFRAVFAPSSFVAKVLVDSGVSIPVRMIGYAPRLERFAGLYAARQSPPRKGEKFTFLHVSSAFPRKGVDVLLSAFARAFAATIPVRLVIKTFPNPHNETARQIELLCAAHADLPEITLIDRDLDEDELLALYRDADAFVLPSRGEGFNIPAAEAMAAGIPLIVTGAGGHADFITEQDAILLPWRVQRSRSHLKTGQSLWLEPDEAALTHALSELFGDLTSGRGDALARAAAARQAVLRRLDRAAWARRIADTSVDLLLTPPARPHRFAWISSWDVRCGVAEYTRHLVAAFGALASPDDTLLMLGDDRINGRIKPDQDNRLRVLPAWTQGDTGSLDRLASIVSREDPQMLMIQHQPGLITWTGLAQLLTDPRLRSRAVVLTLHTTLHLLDAPVEEQFAVLDAMRGTARVIVHTVPDMNLLRDLGLSANVVMVPQGTPALESWRTPRTLAQTDTPVIGCYGFLLPSKGLGRLIAAIPLIRKTWPGGLRVRLVNALYHGSESSDELLACRSLASELGVGDCIEWITDFLPHERSMAHLRECDLIVLPYKQTQEASSAALRSSLASGTPVAVTPIPIFDEAEGAVARFAGDTPAMIADGVMGLLADAEARKALQASARQWLEERSWDKIARQMHGMVTGLAVNRVTEPEASAAAMGKAETGETGSDAASPQSMKAAYA